VNTTPGHFALPAREDRSPWPARRTYLRQSGVQITGRWFLTDVQRYDVFELDALSTVRGAHDPMVATIGAGAGATMVVIVVGASFLSDQPVVWLAAAVLALVLVGLAVAYWRFHPRPYQLWAEYHGRPVRLFGCPDEKTYGHVCRALIRAREAQPPAAPTEETVLPAA
jgi:hypothetical protein